MSVGLDYTLHAVAHNLVSSCTAKRGKLVGAIYYNYRCSHYRLAKSASVKFRRHESDSSLGESKLFLGII